MGRLREASKSKQGKKWPFRMSQIKSDREGKRRTPEAEDWRLTKTVGRANPGLVTVTLACSERTV